MTSYSWYRNCRSLRANLMEKPSWKLCHRDWLYISPFNFDSLSARLSNTTVWCICWESSQWRCSDTKAEKLSTSFSSVKLYHLLRHNLWMCLVFRHEWQKAVRNRHVERKPHENQRFIGLVSCSSLLLAAGFWIRLCTLPVGWDSVLWK